MTLQVYTKYYSRPRLMNNTFCGMNLQSKKSTPPISFSGNENTDGTTTQNDFWKIGAAIAATTLVTATATTLICRHFSAKQLEKLEQECQKLRKNCEMLSDQHTGKYYNDLKAKIDGAELNYDIMHPPKVASEKVRKPKAHEEGAVIFQDLKAAARKHIPVKPTEIQKRKILILKEAIKELTPSLKKVKFTPEEIDTKIYLFDKISSQSSFFYRKKKIVAQARIDTQNGQAANVRTSKGFWIDKTYLDKNDFGVVLECALHEMSHKIGGDETSAFSYFLTEVNAQTLKQLLDTHPETYKKLCALNKLWKEYSSATAKA